MMKKAGQRIFLFLLGTVVFLAPRLNAEDILKILEGYGRDSVSAYSEDAAQEEAARLFNLILEPDGEIVVSQAEQYLKDSESGIVRAYLCVMLADYAFVNKRDDNGLHYLRRAVEEHDPIRNDSYYRLVLSRAQKLIAESPGKTNEGKHSVLMNYSPPPVKGDPAVKAVPEGEASPERKSPPATVPAESEPVPERTINYRIQVGAFSLKDNAVRRQEFFEDKGFPTEIEIRRGSSGTLYLVRIGAYEGYQEAKQALSRLKEQYPSEEGIVVKVAKE